MKLFAALFFICLINVSNGSELVKQVRNNIHASLQENIPDFYVAHWCKKHVEPWDLNDAILQGRNGVLKRALFHDPLLIKNPNLLFSAIKADNRFAVQELLAQGADVNSKDEKGQSPIEYALEKPDRNSSFIIGLLLAKNPQLTKNVFALSKKTHKLAEVSYFADYVSRNNRQASLEIIPDLVADSDEAFLIPWVNKDSELAKKAFKEILDADKKEFLKKIFVRGDEVKSKLSKELTQDQIHKLFSNYPFSVARVFLTDEQIARSVLVCDKDPALTADRQEISDVVQYIVNKPELASRVRHALCAPFLDDQKGQATLFALMGREWTRKPFKGQDVEYALEIGDHDYFDLIRRTDSRLIDEPLKEDGTTILMEAACKKYTKFVELPLSSSAILKTLENRNQNNDTALSCAIRADNKRAALVLLHCGAHIFADQSAMEAVKDASSDMQKEIATQLENRANYLINLELLYRETYDLIKQSNEINKKINQGSADELRLCSIEDSSLYNRTLGDEYCTKLENRIKAKDGSADLDLCFQEFTLLLSEGPDCLSVEAIKEINQKLISKIQKKSEILARDSKCSICLEDYSKIPRVLVCKNSHKICLKCYGNPTLDKCPLCRDEFHIDKLTLCQTCHKNEESTKLFYCAQCDYTSIVCKECIHFPCCKRDVSLNEGEIFLNGIKSAEFARAYLAHRQESLTLECSQFEKKLVIEIEKIKVNTAKRLTELKKNMEKIELKIHEKMKYLYTLKMEFDRAQKEAHDAFVFYAGDRASFFRSNRYYDAQRDLKRAAEKHNSWVDLLMNMEKEHNQFCEDYNRELKNADQAIALLVEKLKNKRVAHDSLLQSIRIKLSTMKNI